MTEPKFQFSEHAKLLDKFVTQAVANEVKNSLQIQSSEHVEKSMSLSEQLAGELANSVKIKNL